VGSNPTRTINNQVKFVLNILKLSSEYSIEHIGRMLKVSGNAVRKKIKKLKENSLQIENQMI
jgi:biotin operon repressor